MRPKSLQAVQLDLYRRFRGKVSSSKVSPISANGFTFKANPKTFSFINTSRFFTDKGWFSQLRLDVLYDATSNQYTYEACPKEEVAPAQDMVEEIVPVQDSAKKVESFDLQEGKIYQISDGERVYLVKVTFIGVSHFEVLVVDPIRGLFYASEFPFSRVEMLTISIPDARIRKKFSDILYQYKQKGNDLPRVEDGVFEIKTFSIHSAHH